MMNTATLSDVIHCTYDSKMMAQRFGSWLCSRAQVNGLGWVRQKGLNPTSCFHLRTEQWLKSSEEAILNVLQHRYKSLEKHFIIAQVTNNQYSGATW
jgi:hypothetical protein